MTGASLPERLCTIDTASTVMAEDIMMPFAFDEVYGRQVGEGLRDPAVHIWRHQKAFVLGSRDWKLPRVQEAVRWLQAQGYEVTVRNSGGAAVPLDPGVVNLSLILPTKPGDLDLQRHFVRMAELIRQCLGQWSSRVDTGEVGGSYCPGEFDVSIDGKKFCGIAQRRLTRAVIIQAFVLAEGSGEERGKLVKAFYERAAGDSSEADHPVVEPTSMSSLAELLGESCAESFVTLIRQQLDRHGLVYEHRDYASFDLEGVQKTADEYRRRYHVHV